MSGLKRKAQHEQPPEKKGGMVRGPGTGTSDSIRAQVPDGSFIMPADSTAQIGEDALNQMGAPRLGLPWKRQQDVPVNLSNGEFNLPPEQVHAVGAEALRQMKDATHAPVAAAQNGGPRLGWPGYVPPDEKPVGGGFGLNLERLRRHAEEMKNGGGGPRLGWPGYVPPSSPEPSGRGFGFKPREGDQGEPGPFFADGGQVGKERGFGWRGYADGGLVEDDTKPLKPSPMGLSYNDVRNSAPTRQPSGPIGSNVSSTGPTTRPIVKPQAQQPATTESPSGFTPVQYGKIDQSLLPRNSPQMPHRMLDEMTGVSGTTMRAVDGTSNISRIDAPGKSPLYTNDPGATGDFFKSRGTVNTISADAMSGGVKPMSEAEQKAMIGTPVINGYGGRLSFDSLARTAAMNAENNNIRQNRMDGRPDGWSRETVSSDKQHLTYQHNKATEDADRARFFGPTLLDQRNAEQGGGRRRGGQSASEAQAEKAAAYDTRALGYQRALTALGDNESAMRQTQMREQGDTQRAGMAQSVGLANAATNAREVDSQGRLTDVQVADQRMISSLRAEYLAEENPTTRERLGQALAMMAGRDPQPDTSLEQARIKAVSDLYKVYGEQAPVGADKKTPIPFEQWAGPAMAMMGQQQSQAPTAPYVGEVRGGYRFKGGAFGDQANWEELRG